MSKIFKFDFYGSAIENIKPSKNFIPEWYKNIKVFNYKNIEFDTDLSVTKTVKNCIPFLDSMTTGYTIELWTDLHCYNDNGAKSFVWQEGPIVLEERFSNYNNLAVPEGHLKRQYAWKVPYAFNLPKGYSMLITHPLNQFDLPFTTMSGIVDGDYYMTAGNIPFFIKENFEGVIKKGTPLIQIIPFKRENWESKRDESLYSKTESVFYKSRRTFFGWYRDNIWQKKNFK